MVINITKGIINIAFLSPHDIVGGTRNPYGYHEEEIRNQELDLLWPLQMEYFEMLLKICFL